MLVPPGKKVYFLSDIHLGAPDRQSSLDRERRLVLFLDDIRRDAAALFIVGDLFEAVPVLVEEIKKAKA